ncbi:enoyl-CoA hydratase/isomerase family protein [Nonomuraea ferruginea]
MADEPILIEQRKHVAIVTLNRPRQRNALSSEMLKGVVEALDWAEGESSVRAVVLTGGTKLFASGADLRELRDTTPRRLPACGAAEGLAQDRRLQEAAGRRRRRIRPRRRL